MKSKLQFLIFGSLAYIATSFVLYHRGFLKGYRIGYKNAFEVRAQTIKSEQSKTDQEVLTNVKA